MAKRLSTGSWALLLLAAGCDAPHLLPPDDFPAEQPLAAAPASRFDPATAGTVQGRVVWRGAIPSAPPLKVPLIEPGKFTWDIRPNPNAPDIDPNTRTVRGAVVFLRGVNAAAARPWDLPPVRVEAVDLRYRVVQGDRAGGVGFVRRGDVVEFVSLEERYHVARGRGASFFALTLPDPNRPARRALDRRGLVELTSAAQSYWMQAYLFVDDHPYYAVTDAQGRFALPRVPAGRYELTAWLPNWRVERQERDPESALVARQFFGPPLTATQTVEVVPAGVCETAVTLGEKE